MSPRFFRRSSTSESSSAFTVSLAAQQLGISQQEAEEAVQYLRSQGLPAVATNGEDAHLTLQKAFAAKQNTIIRMAETILGEEMK